jgi:hypothetical protein
MNEITKIAAALVLACTVPAGAALAADKAAKPAAKAADAKPSPAAADAAKAAGPKLDMAKPVKNPGKDVDLRHCLDLGTNSEVIRCAEQGDAKA